MINQIPTRQNEPKQIERLAAQRELYSEAKRWQVGQLVSSIVAVGLGVWSLLDKENELVANASAVLGFAILALDLWLVNPIIKRKRQLAAKIQERFDCYVLDLNCSPIKDPVNATDEKVHRYFEKHRRDLSNIDKLKDWYPLAVGVLPLHLGRLICQRSNCSWDAELRRRYSTIALVLLVVTISALIVVGIMQKMELTRVLMYCAAFGPFIQYCYSQYVDQKEASEQQSEFVHQLINIWENKLHEDEQTLTAYSRQLQDAIYDVRSNSPAILNFFYERLKTEQENTMNRTAEDLVIETQQRLSQVSNNS